MVELDMTRAETDASGIRRDIVVVGASAGGVEALECLLGGLPATFPAAVLVVLHIPPHSRSQLHSVLASATVLPVKAAEDGEAILPGHVYVAPTDRHLLVEPECLRVTRGPKENRMRPAVDALFRSAAYTFGRRVIGIVLSGSLDDGTAGLWAVKDRGGVAIVQSPEDARHASMPESALRHVEVDCTLPVNAMPALLQQLTRERIPLFVEEVMASHAMGIETSVALDGAALRGGIMLLGPASPHLCPECQGVLVRVQEGPIARYRCHTGHAFSLQTLLAGLDEEIDDGLSSALRAIEERILLLRELEQMARARQDWVSADHCAEQVRATDQDVLRVRELVLDRGLLGQVARTAASELHSASDLEPSI
jgi:two-component system, chemotaxis family, protein-glutamate methylesterase/glutaminase